MTWPKRHIILIAALSFVLSWRSWLNMLKDENIPVHSIWLSDLAQKRILTVIAGSILEILHEFLRKCTIDRSKVAYYLGCRLTHVNMDPMIPLIIDIQSSCPTPLNFNMNCTVISTLNKLRRNTFAISHDWAIMSLRKQY